MRTIRFRGTSVQFPQACAVCLNGGWEKVEFERTFIHGRHIRILKQPVPLCYDHARLAHKKSLAQIWCGRVALDSSIILMLLVATGLVYYWLTTGQGQLLWNIPLALIVGASLGFTLWAATMFWLRPSLASHETKEVHESVRMTRYDPVHDLLDVCFENDTFAELTARQNLSILDQDMTGLKRYHLGAAIHSDDVRLVGSLDSNVLLDHVPSETEARDLLEPEALKVMAQNGGKDCFYSVYVTEIEEKEMSHE